MLEHAVHIICLGPLLWVTGGLSYQRGPIHVAVLCTAVCTDVLLWFRVMVIRRYFSI